MEIKKGDLVAIFGPNGIGKTTLLKLLSGLIKPLHGNIEINTNKIGFLVQRNVLDPHFPLTLEELVGMGHICDDMTCVETAMRAVDLWNIRHKYPDEISGGQFQRALFARMIVQNPDLILLDEPFNAVDCQTLNHLIVQIKKWHTEGKTVLVVLHDYDLIQTHFEECIFLGAHFVKKLKIKEMTHEKMTQMLFCGQHYAV